MSKVKGSVSDLFKVPVPHISNAVVTVPNNQDLVQTCDEDDITLGLPDTLVIDDFEVPQVLNTAEALNVYPNVAAHGGTDATVDFLNTLNPVSGALRTSKPLASRYGTFNLSPFGLVFPASADVINLGTMTTAMNSATPGINGDSLNASAFVAYEARVNMAVRAAINRDMAMSGAAANERIAAHHAFATNLMWLQEFINTISRMIGWHSWAAKYQLVEPNFATYPALRSPEFYDKCKLLVSLIKDYPVLDESGHQLLQFMNDFHILERENIRIPTIEKRAVNVHTYFRTGSIVSTGTGTPTIVGNASPIPIRLTHASLRLTVGDDGLVTDRRDLPTVDYVEAMLMHGTIADVLNILDEIIAIVTAMSTDYAAYLKYMSTAIGKGIVTANTLGSLLYHNGDEFTIVEPYYSHKANAIRDGLPRFVIADNAIPQIIAKILLDYTSGLVYTADTWIQARVGNVARFGVSVPAKSDTMDEIAFQTWIVYSWPAANTKVLTNVSKFVNPYTGLGFQLNTGGIFINNGVGTRLAHEILDVDSFVTVYDVAASTLVVKPYPTFNWHSVAGRTFITIELLGGGFGSPAGNTAYEYYGHTQLQQRVTQMAYPGRWSYIAAKDTVGEIGFAAAVYTIQHADDVLVPVDDLAIRKNASKFYTNLYPNIEASKYISSK